MSFRRRGFEGDEAAERGFTGFVRSLLAGIPWSERSELRETVVVPAPSGGLFRIHNSNGRTRVVGGDRDDIEVEAFKSARAESPEAAVELLDGIQLVFAETPEGLDLDVEIPRKWNRRGFVNLCITLPRKMNVWVAAANGRVDVCGLHGTVRAKSTNGSVSVGSIVGDVEVATSNAKVCCRETTGRLTARSSNGKIEIEQHCGSVDASTSNGLIRASLDQVGESGIQLATSNGRIVLDLPDVVDADVDIRVDNGVIRNDRTLEKTTRETGGRVLGRLGGGGPLIKLRTSNGSITLH